MNSQGSWSTTLESVLFRSTTIHWTDNTEWTIEESRSLLYMHSEAEYRIAADLRDNVMRGDTPTGGDTCGPLHREWQAASAGSSPLAPQGHALRCCDALSRACVIPLSYQIHHKISNCLSLTFTLGSAPLRHPRVNIGKSNLMIYLVWHIIHKHFLISLVCISTVQKLMS